MAKVKKYDIKMSDKENFYRFAFELDSLIKEREKLPISKRKIMAITKAGLKATRYYKSVIASIEKFVQNCSTSYKITGLYLMDSLIRYGRHKLEEGNGQEIFVNGFRKNLTTTFTHVCKCPDDVKEKITRILTIWSKQNIYDTNEILTPLFDMADPTKVQSRSHHHDDDVDPSLTLNTENGGELVQNFDTQITQDQQDDEDNELQFDRRPVTVAAPPAAPFVAAPLIGAIIDDQQPSNSHLALDELRKSQREDSKKVENGPNFASLTSILSNPVVLLQLQKLQEAVAMAAAVDGSKNSPKKLHDETLTETLTAPTPTPPPPSASIGPELEPILEKPGDDRSQKNIEKSSLSPLTTFLHLENGSNVPRTYSESLAPSIITSEEEVEEIDLNEIELPPYSPPPNFDDDRSKPTNFDVETNAAEMKKNEKIIEEFSHKKFDPSLVEAVELAIAEKMRKIALIQYWMTQTSSTTAPPVDYSSWSWWSWPTTCVDTSGRINSQNFESSSQQPQPSYQQSSGWEETPHTPTQSTNQMSYEQYYQQYYEQNYRQYYEKYYEQYCQQYYQQYSTQSVPPNNDNYHDQVTPQTKSLEDHQQTRQNFSTEFPPQSTNNEYNLWQPHYHKEAQMTQSPPAVAAKVEGAREKRPGGGGDFEIGKHFGEKRKRTRFHSEHETFMNKMDGPPKMTRQGHHVQQHRPPQQQQKQQQRPSLPERLQNLAYNVKNRDKNYRYDEPKPSSPQSVLHHRRVDHDPSPREKMALLGPNLDRPKFLKFTNDFFEGETRREKKFKIFPPTSPPVRVFRDRERGHDHDTMSMRRENFVVENNFDAWQRRRRRQQQQQLSNYNYDDDVFCNNFDSRERFSHGKIQAKYFMHEHDT